jgi:putative transposase
MGKTYYKLYYHTIWRTYKSLPLITPSIERLLIPYLQTYINKLECVYFIANGTCDHIHVVLSIPPKLSISNVIGKIKGSSSHYINKDRRISDNFYWQAGFGVLSYKEKDLRTIINYVRNQKAHHKNNTLVRELEISDDDT